MSEFLWEITSGPLFGVTLTIFFLYLAQKVAARFRSPLINPMLLAVAGIIAFLQLTGIPLESYEPGGELLTFFLGPVTVALAVPLYSQLENLRKNLVPILIGITAGSLAGILVTLLLGRIFSLRPSMIASLAPKCTTTAIAVELSKTFGGEPAFTVAFVMVAGTLGNVFGEPFLKVLRIKNPTARGVGMGTASHAFGTNKALEMGPEEGAMSSLAIGIAGVVTTLLMPFLISLFM